MIYRTKQHEYRIAYYSESNSPFCKDNKKHECILTSNERGRYHFWSDGKKIDLNEHDKKIIAEAKTGDIFWVTDSRRLSPRFDSSEDDATIFMGGNCNSNCMMCPASEYERREDYHIERSCISEFVQMLPAWLSHYVVTGGEPTLDPKLFLEVMSDLAEHIPYAEALLLTNGRSFTYKAFLDKMLQKCPQHLTAAVPVHGSTPAVHDRIIRVDGGFAQTMQGIRNLLNGGIAVEIRIVVTRLNMGDIDNIAALIADQFPEVIVVNFINLEVRGSCFTNRDQVYLTPEESFRSSRNAIDRLIASGIDVGLYNYPLCSIEESYWTLNHNSITPSKIRYYDVCDKCDVKKYCGGFFVSSKNTVHPLAKPIRNGANVNDKSL